MIWIRGFLLKIFGMRQICFFMAALVPAATLLAVRAAGGGREATLDGALLGKALPAASRGLAQQTEPPGHAAAIPGKQLIPWLELNITWKEIPGYPGLTGMEHCLLGLKEWARTTDTVIITSNRPQFRHAYPELEAGKPKGMHIIGGLKTMQYLPRDRFDDIEGWRLLTEDCVKISRMTRTNVIVLENETALEEFYRGNAAIDEAKLKEALKPLAASGLETWWNRPYAMAADPKDPDRPKRFVFLMSALAAALPNAKLMSVFKTHEGISQAGRLDMIARERQMSDLLSPNQIIQRIHVRKTGFVGRTRAFTPEEALVAISKWPDKAVILYPGASEWVEVGRMLAESAQRRDASENKTASEKRPPDGAAPERDGGAP